LSRDGEFQFAMAIAINSSKCVGEFVGIALAPDFSVGDDIDSCAFEFVDSGERGVVLRLLEPLLWNPPQLGHPQPRDSRAQLVAID
jgi:hypothetical protein